jgi:hypothetical protein
MFQRHPTAYVGSEPLLGILPNADPGHMEALAAYFEYQARLLRDAAALKRQRARDAEYARTYRARAKVHFLRVGARAHVLARTWGDAAAVSEMALRESWSLEQTRYALARWRKLKGRRHAPRKSAGPR